MSLESVRRNLYSLIVKPLTTEKSVAFSEKKSNVRTFIVSNNATKSSLRVAFKQLFGADVVKINTMKVKGKRKVFKGIRGVRSLYSKAIVTFADNVNCNSLFGE